MIVIRSTGDLAQLDRLASDPGGSDEKIVLDVAGMEERAASAWQAKLERHAFSCGCGTGLVFLLFAAAAYLTAWGSSVVGLASIAWSDAVLALAVIFAAAVVGKFVGLAYSHLQLRRAINVLEKVLRDLESRPRGSTAGARGNRG